MDINPTKRAIGKNGGLKSTCKSCIIKVYKGYFTNGCKKRLQSAPNAVLIPLKR